MKAKFFLLSLISFTYLIAGYSQVQYTSQGKFGIGFTTGEWPIYDFQLKATYPTLLLQSEDYNKDIFIRMTEGDDNYFQGAYINYDGINNKLILGTHNTYDSNSSNDKDVLSITRSSGRIDFNPIVSTDYSTTFRTNVSEEYSINYGLWLDGYSNAKFYVEGDGSIHGWRTILTSDSTLKENIESISNSMDLISRLRPVSYSFKSSFQDSESRKNKKEYGLIAQELELVIPELVVERSDGVKGINYTGIIPLLIDVVQNQQQEIDDLKELLISSPPTEKIATTSSNVQNMDINASISQNIPNPFTDVTKIFYNIPEFRSQAMIRLYDLQGKQIMSFQISNTGIGEITIPGSELDPGIYIYNLIVDGMEVDTKRMVLTD